jgi:CBS domain-containing protein
MNTLVLRHINATELPIPGADPWHASPDDPAIAVMTDFREHSSVSVVEGTTLDAALEHMKHVGVRCAFVTSPARQVVGLITAYDILGEKPTRYTQATGGRRKDVVVDNIMTRIADWRTADVKDLERLTVAAVAHVFDETQLTHIAVMESGERGAKRLRGLLSAARVKRLLATPATKSR